MKLNSATDTQLSATWSQAVLNGLAGDGGLFLPTSLPCLTPDDCAKLADKPLSEVAYELASRFLSEEVPHSELRRICDEAFNFPLPLVQINNQIQILELFHGPTCAFKDFGARFMSRLFRYFWGQRSEQLTVLVATSGDTGGAVANAFFDPSPNPPIKVAVLFPRDKVTAIQRRQMTTLGHNITAYQLDGTFDDCQKLVKQALSDTDLRRKVQLTSANSINIARLIPQMFYYAHTALKFIGHTAPIISVPSGNLGNITGALLAQMCGFKLGHLIAACNSNRPFPDFLTNGSFNPGRSLETISNAMDVGNPSNFQRILRLCQAKCDLSGANQVSKLISAQSISDHTTCETLKEFYHDHGYLLDPHTAVGVAAAKIHLKQTLNASTPTVIAATAHPAKFSEAIEKIVGFTPQQPVQLSNLIELPERITPLGNDYAQLIKALIY